MAIRNIDLLSPDALDSVQGGGNPGIPDAQRIGDYTQTTRSFGLFSLSDTQYRDRNTGEEFTASSWGVGPSIPGWSVSSGNVYRSESQDPSTTVRDVVTGPGFQGGFGDAASVSGMSASNGYSLQTGGAPFVGMEYTHTNEGVTTVPPHGPPGMSPSDFQTPSNLPDTTPTSQDLYGDVPNLSGGTSHDTDYNQYSELGPHNELDQQYRADHAGDTPDHAADPPSDTPHDSPAEAPSEPASDAGADNGGGYQETGAPDGGGDGGDSAYA